MKRILFLALLITLFSCGGDRSESSSAKAQSASTAQVVTTPQPPANLTLSVANQSIKSGQTSCLDITVADFRSLISMQYSMKWDPAILEFQEVKGFTLPHLSAQNFGTHRVQEGILTSVWIDNSLKGQTLSDGAPIFQVCLKAVGNAGQTSTFAFLEQPTPFEVVTVEEKVVSINGVEGMIKVE